MQRLRTRFVLAGMFIVLTVAGACTYYKSVIIAPKYNQTGVLDQIRLHWEQGDPIFIHSRIGIFRLRGLRTDTLANRLMCTAEFPDEVTTRFTQPYRRHGRFRRSIGEGVILQQVHVFVSDSALIVAGNPLVLDSTAILRVEQIKSDVARNVLLTSSLTLGLSAAALAALVMVAINQMTIGLNLKP
ncbi:MAG: hypothetical protein ACKOQY_01060 [Bacteroidota bacterium]